MRWLNGNAPKSVDFESKSISASRWKNGSASKQIDFSAESVYISHSVNGNDMKSVDLTSESIHIRRCVNGNGPKSVDSISKSISASCWKSGNVSKQTDFSAESISTCSAISGISMKSIDIGLNKPADDFIAAIKKYKPDIVGASAIIGPVTPYCGVIHKAMVDASVRDEVIYITGGWNMTPEWCDAIGADAYGEDAADGLEKVKLLLAGELPKWKDRVKA